jgi:hypothetical protein
LHGEGHLVADVSTLLGFSIHTVKEIFPWDRVLEQDKIGMRAEGFVVVQYALQRSFRRRRKKAVRCVASLEDR